MKQRKYLIYIFCYFLIHLAFLTDFPFVHSDEAWLSGLSRNMMENGDLGVTETFYDLKPRYPHAIKTIFHLLQIAMLSVFGYDVFTFRLLSLIFSCAALFLFYQVLKIIFDCLKATTSSSLNAAAPVHADLYPLLGMILLSCDIQFIYASHFARQEVLLVCSLIACLLALLKNKFLIAGLITGLSIGLHPNSFLIGTMCAAILLPVQNRFSSWKPLLGYAGVTAGFAAFFVALSLSFDKEFFRHYLAYGNSEFDIGAPVTSKLLELPYFLTKIWQGVSGTYYVPDVRFEFLLFSLAALSALLLLIIGKFGLWAKIDATGAKGSIHRASVICHQAEIRLISKGIAGILAGMVLIGRYNQTSIVFLFPLFFLLVLMLINKAGSVARNFLVFALCVLLAIMSIVQITPWLPFSYSHYLDEIAKVVRPENRVLANLNSEYYFDNGKLLDYRNLAFLKDAQMSVEEYIRANDIEYIILSDEMDLIYSQRPLWNMIYGNPRYMEELHAFLEENCALRHQFTDNVYGIRIIPYLNRDRDFTVKIFQVNEPL